MEADPYAEAYGDYEFGSRFSTERLGGLDEILFYLNGKKIQIKNPPTDITLLQYLRSNGVGLTGTKLGCGEGGCGACTVMISHWDLFEKKVVHRAVNACLAPLCSVDGHLVVTVEGIGNTKHLHPIQERLAQFHGSQCGFCTPGIIMALYAFLRGHPNATMSEIEESFDGNLCRCTGYRPILEAARTFAVDYEPPSADAAKLRICPGTGLPCNCTRVEDAEDGPTIKFEGGTEPIFPPALRRYVPASLKIQSPDTGLQWWRPTKLEELLLIKRTTTDAKIVVGSSEVTIEVNLKRGKEPYRVLVSPQAVPELNTFTENEEGAVIGGAVSLTRVGGYLKTLIKKHPEHKTSTFRAVVEQLKWFAGHQIRNVASLAGNIATASPISDINPVLAAAGAYITVQTCGEEPRKVYLDRKFFLGYRTIVLQPTDVIITVHIPFTREHEYVTAYKQARRKDDDIAIVSGCFRTLLVQAGDNWVIQKASLCYGGMAPISKFASEETEKWMEGKVLDDAMIQHLFGLLEKDFPLDAHAPGGMITYRRTLVLSFFYKYFLTLRKQLGLSVPEKSLPALAEHHRPISTGSQDYVQAQDTAPVGVDTAHQSGLKQVTGEAIYVDDMPVHHNELFAAMVHSEKAHALIKSVDASAALEHHGVVAYFGANDVPYNQIGPVIKDEELFASNEVLCIGYPIGIVVAKTQREAQQAARLVKVKYEELDSVLTIQEAIEKNAFFAEKHHITRGDVDKGFESCDHIIEGKFEMGGQEHFYLETQGTLAIPGEEDELTIISSTQNPGKTQAIVANVLQIAANRVVCKLKRMGGGFGGKETRSIYVSAAAAVAAHKLHRPVRIILDRDEDMLTSGGRHPFAFEYKVGVTKEGKIQALDVKVYANAGCTMDLSGGVTDRALFHVDNAYFIPNLRARAWMCKTNLPSNTAFRGFGGPQAMMLAETYIGHIAKTLGIHPHKIREINMYQEGQLTHYLQPVVNCNMQRVWEDMLARSNFTEREAATRKFNETSQYKKRGLACVPVKFGMSFTVRHMNQAASLVHIYNDGTVLVSHGGTEMGQGLHTKIIQIAAKTLGTDVASIYVSETSTDKVANTSPTAASVQSDLNGMAVYNACLELAQRLAPLKAKKPDANLAQLAQMAIFERIDLTAHGFYATPDVGYDFNTSSGRPFHYFTYGAACSEVEIDTLTGEMSTLQADLVMDLGQSLNPAIDIGQIEGAYAQGFGLTCLEEVVVDDRYTRTPGKIFTRGPSTYKLPGFKDVPLKLNVHLLPNSQNPGVVYSSKGVGEPPLFLGASVFFAVKEAIQSARADNGFNGYFNLSSPATCERIRMSCKDPISARFDDSAKTY